MLEEVWLEDSKAIETKSKVFYARKDGQQIEFLTTLDIVIKFWEKLLF